LGKNLRFCGQICLRRADKEPERHWRENCCAPDMDAKAEPPLISPMPRHRAGQVLSWLAHDHAVAGIHGPFR